MVKQKKSNLPAELLKAAENLRAAATTVGAGSQGGASYLKVDDRSGAVVHGPNRDPVPLKHRFAVNLKSFAHGWIDFSTGERDIRPMWQCPVRPVPPNGYRTAFGAEGAADATELTLTSLTEPGFELVFTPTGVSSANRCRSLLEDALNHLGTAEGQNGYVHPVVEVMAGSYEHHGLKRTIFHFDYRLCDWLSDDGELASQAGPRIEASSAAAPWDTADA